MSTHLEVTAALVYGTGLPVYDSMAERPTYDPADWSKLWTEEQQTQWQLETPYAVLGAPSVFAEDARTLSRKHRDIGDDFRLTITGRDPREVRHWAGLVKVALNDARPELEGYSTWIRWSDSTNVLKDPSVPMPGPDYLCYAVHTYRLDSTPI